MDLNTEIYTIIGDNLDNNSRNYWWELFNEKMVEHIDQNTRNLEQKIKYILSLIKDTKKNNLKSPNSNFRSKYEILIDVLNHILENYHIEINIRIQDNIDDFYYYPEQLDELFNKKIYQKKEFNGHKIPKQTNIQKKSKHFEKSSIQKFVSNYVSKYTPYNGILLWYGVGSGKTCAALSIAENFREYVYQNNNKILILLPSDTLKGNWKDEIFNIEKEINNKYNHNVQCTGSIYKNHYEILKDLSHENQKRKMDKLINNYYEFMGYQKFAGQIEKKFIQIEEIYSSDKVEYMKIKYIEKFFSNRVIIMDEAHFTRENEQNIKKTRIYIEMIARYGKNNKLILLTATPMYNTTKEIIWLINLLLWNDRRSPIEEQHIFNADGLTIKTYEEDGDQEISHAYKILIQKSRGYISYLRGENPFTFPYKLYPMDTNKYTPRPLKQYQNNEWVDLHDGEKIVENSLIFYKNQMSKWQYKKLGEYYSTNQEDIDDLKKISFDRQPLQISNIVFPSYETTLEIEGYEDPQPIGYIGKNGFEKAFDFAHETNQYRYKNSNGYDLGNINESGKGFLHLDNIGKYSCKFKNIIENIQTSHGIVFVFSQFINHGIKSLALALEENGFIKCDGNNKTSRFLDKDVHLDNRFCSTHKKFFRDLTELEKVNFNQAKYIYLDGTIDKNVIDTLVKEVKGQGLDENGNFIPNLHGEHILVILGSKVVEQGISFFNVRETHIMDPWHHLNMMEQASGRAFRQTSHIMLPKEEQNVTLFMHIASLPIEYEHIGNETPDEKVYRKAYFKKIQMSKIERVLKKNAVDCLLNRNGNIFLKEDYPKTLLMKNSKNNEVEGHIYNEDYSMICDFDICDYKCNVDDRHIQKIDIDTYNEFFSKEDVEFIKELISQLYEHEYSYTLGDFIDKIKDFFTTNDENIYIALTEMINQKYIIHDLYNRPGRLIYRNKLYIYQPLEINDENVPLHYRQNPFQGDIKRDIHYKIEPIEKSKPKKEIYTLNSEQLENIYKKY